LSFALKISIDESKVKHNLTRKV